MKTPIILRIYRNGKIESTKQFDLEQIVIGANSDAQVSLAADGVSALHAVIEERDTGYYIVDLGSAAGTFRGGQKVFDEALKSGDEIQVGPYKIEFFIGVPKPAQAPPPSVVLTATSLKPTQPPPVPSTPMPADKPAASPVPLKSSLAAKSTPVTTNVPASVISDETTITSPGTSAKNDDALAARFKSSRGPVVEVIVAWKDIVIDTVHFHDKQIVTIGAEESATINLPLLGLNRTAMTLLDIQSLAKVRVTHEMTGDYYRDEEHLSLAELKRKNRIIQNGTDSEIELAQGEMIRLGLMGDLVSIYIRYVNEMPAPMIGPLLDFSTSEATAILTSAVVAAIFGLYMLIYNPTALQPDKNVEQPARIAVIQFDRPKVVVPVTEQATTQKKRIIKVSEHAQTATRHDAGRAAELKRVAKLKKSAVASSIVKRGGTVKTGKAAAGLRTQKPRNINKLGLLGVFGNQGTQKELSQAAAGAGELVGDANQKTGYSGSNEQRAGDLGGRLRNVGASGNGAATYGIAGGIGTTGKGTGTFGGGLGGLGRKGTVDLNVGDSEAEFTGSIDKDAIRRVIRQNRAQLQFCYDQALRRNSDVYGKIELHWEIVEHGRATNVRVKSNSVGDREMGRCLARVISGLTFPEPPPDTAADVIYPFVFAIQ